MYTDLWHTLLSNCSDVDWKCWKYDTVVKNSCEWFAWNNDALMERNKLLSQRLKQGFIHRTCPFNFYAWLHAYWKHRVNWRNEIWIFLENILLASWKLWCYDIEMFLKVCNLIWVKFHSFKVKLFSLRERVNFHSFTLREYSRTLPGPEKQP